MELLMEKILVRKQDDVSPVIKMMREKGLRVGILHSGGPASGGNHLIAAAAKPFLDHGLEVVGFRSGFNFLEQRAKNEISHEELLDKHLINITYSVASKSLDQNGLIIGTSRANPGKDIKSPADLYDPQKTETIEKIIAIFQELKIGALITLGGDDTLKTANYFQAIAQLMRAKDAAITFQGVVHAPKTIDKDYKGIDFTYGFFTAVEIASKLIRNLHDDAEATDTWHVVELMGRDAGWITGAASVAGRATTTLISEQFEDIIHLPDIAEKLVREVILPREAEKKAYGVICLAEGLGEKLPKESVKDVGEDLHGHVKLADVRLGLRLTDILKEKYKEITGRELSTKPHSIGYEIRQAEPVVYDKLLCFQLGIGAFRLIESGRFGEMVSLKDGWDIYGIKFDQLINPETLKVQKQLVDLSGDFFAMIQTLQRHCTTA
jgi:ATP-dependent phosphofructokinase / diphosphate-dependent phosphofructokinase